MKSNFSSTSNYSKVQSQLSEPKKYLDGIPETRATFTPITDMSLLDPTDTRAGCCAVPRKGEKCTIF